MKKNLAVDVPRDAETEVDRIRGLKKSIFTRTRIACLCLVMVLALSVSSTLAYEKWSGNATPNRTGGMVDVSLKIGERKSADSTTITYEDGNFDYGKDSKYVRIEMSDKLTEADARVAVSILLELKSKNYRNSDNTLVTAEDAYVAYNGDWSSVKQETQDEAGAGKTRRYYVETSVARIYLADDYASNWIYANGVFEYNKTLGKGAKSADLVTGIMLLDDSLANEYASVRVKIVARAATGDVAEEEETTS